MRAPRRPRLPTPPLRLPPLNRGSGGGIPERPRRKPQVFPESHGPYPLCPFGTSPPDRGSRPPAAFCLLCRRGQSRSPPQRRNLCFALREFRRLRTASFFLSDQKETKESLGAAHGHLRCPTPPAPRPPFLRWSPLWCRHSWPARCPLERCLTVIAAALLKNLSRYFYKMTCAWVPEHTPWALVGGRPHGSALRSKSGTGERMISAPTMTHPLFPQRTSAGAHCAPLRRGSGARGRI